MMTKNHRNRDRVPALPPQEDDWLGDDFALQVAQAYTSHRSTLVGLARSRLGMGSGAEDLIQDAFVRLMKSYRGNRIDNLPGLLYRIAINIFRDDVRAASYRRRQSEEMLNPANAQPHELDPESSVAFGQKLRRVREAIDSLPPRCREVFLLHRIEGLPHSEVAANLGISRSMVEKHIIRAYAHLRHAMDESENCER